MTKYVFKRFVIGFLTPALGAFLVFRLMASPSPQQVSPRLTAKVQLTNARNLAKKWRADASPVSILGPSVDANGVSSLSSAYSWSYTFDSKKTEKVFMISVGNAADIAALSKAISDNSYLFYIGTDAGLSGSEDERTLTSSCQALPAEFLDSDKAMAAAKAAGYKPDGQIEMRLSKCDAGAAVWELNAFKLDAVTGKPLK